LKSCSLTLVFRTKKKRRIVWTFVGMPGQNCPTEARRRTTSGFHLSLLLREALIIRMTGYL
jgi:hypothetical protein